MTNPAPELAKRSDLPVDLHGLLDPAQPEHFLAEVFGKTYRHYPGWDGKFAELLSWPVLNELLEQHRLEPPRLRLTREGKPVPVEKFLSFQPNRRKNSAPIPRVNAAGLMSELRSGATLVLDAVDELCRPVRRLAESLERRFRVRVQVNAYAGFRTSHGFDLHWDDHDVLVLQAAGRKHWKIYGVTRPFPMSQDVSPAVDPPSEVLWDGLLECGDVLYIPRGWWHVALPLDEPTLHLTVGIHNPTGADLLSWFVERLKAEEDVRRDLPLWDRDAQRQRAERLRRIFWNEWQPGIIEEYLRAQDARSRPRPHFSLPWAASDEMPLPSGSRVAWNGARLPAIERGETEIALEAHGRRWRFAAAALPVLELFAGGREFALDELPEFAPGLPAGQARAFVCELVRAGLVAVR